MYASEATLCCVPSVSVLNVVFLFSCLQTWEGFIGAFFFTCVFAFYFSGFLAKYEWFTCPVQDLNFRPKPIHCKPDALFLPAEFVVVSERQNDRQTDM